MGSGGGTKASGSSCASFFNNEITITMVEKLSSHKKMKNEKDVLL